MADDDGPNNLIHFPRVGYTAPTEPAETPDPVRADVPFAAPAGVSTDTRATFAPATRTSPLDAIAALPEPGLGSPFTADAEPAAAPAPAGAMVPATFRSEGGQPAAPRLGALSLAAILAVSLAAMRGIHSTIASNRASREQREAVAKTASTGKDGSSGGGSKKQVQPSHEYGRKSLQRAPGGPAGRSGGAGPGRSGRGGSGSFSGSGGRGRSGSGGGSRGGRGGGSGSGSGRSNSGFGKGGSGIIPLKRSSQGGGPSLRKNRGSGSSGSGGSGGSGGGRGPNSGGGGGRKRSSGGGSGSSGGGPSTIRKRGPGSTGAGGSPKGSGKKRGPGFSGTGTGKTGPGSKSPGKGTGSGKSGPGASSSKGPGTGKGTGPGAKSGAKKSPRGTTGPGGILRKKPGTTTTSGTGPKTKTKGKDTTGAGGAGTTAPGKGGGKKGKTRSGKGGTGPAAPVPRAPGGKSRRGKKVKLTPGIAHGTMAASDTYGCRCRKCRRFDREYGRRMDAARKSAARGRTTFGEAVHETAEKRLKRRRKKMGPPVVSKVKVRKPKKKTGPKTKTTKPGSTKPAGPAAAGPTGPTGPAAKAPTRRTPWSTAKARARKRARMRTATVPGPRRAPTTGTTTPPKPTAAPPTAPTTAPAPAAAGAATAPSPPGGGTVPGTGEPRLSPFEAMGMATTVSAPDAPITVERADSAPSTAAKSGADLPASTSTKGSSMGDALTKHASGGVAAMDSEHATEITLDDTLDVLEELTQDSFKAHETCRKLAAKAREIRHALDELAADLRSRHNVIGRLTGAAMAKLAESMEVLARKADEMSAKSLAAAELCELAENAMFDAYRPVQRATEDAGLLVPSARIHNEG
ncbi:hypothetical protein ABT010_33595 [Streptomyces sp. NPDC002668]|uniref:hypothetical protein n=1 Tax=Streptomyces sp. NPDC002668 TaxID=3154422 RepID=UPI0033210DC2